MSQIRKAFPSDVPILSDLIRQSFRDVAERFKLTAENCPKHPSNCTDEWIERDFARGVDYFLMEENGFPVGCTGLEKASPEVCYLERLSVLPGRRRKGLGRGLVDHVLGQAAALGAKTVGIGIISGQTELKEWYRKIGFVEGETKRFPHLPFEVAFMAYRL